VSWFHLLSCNLQICIISFFGGFVTGYPLTGYPRVFSCQATREVCRNILSIGRQRTGLFLNTASHFSSHLQGSGTGFLISIKAISFTHRRKSPVRTPIQSNFFVKNVDLHKKAAPLGTSLMGIILGSFGFILVEMT